MSCALNKFAFPFALALAVLASGCDGDGDSCRKKGRECAPRECPPARENGAGAGAETPAGPASLVSERLRAEKAEQAALRALTTEELMHRRQEEQSPDKRRQVTRALLERVPAGSERAEARKILGKPDYETERADLFAHNPGYKSGLYFVRVSYEDGKVKSVDADYCRP